MSRSRVKFIASLTVLLVAGLGVAGDALAIITRMDPGEPMLREFHGDSRNLPVDCQHTPEELVVLARRLPAVQAALREFERRGYVAIPEADTAVTGCSQPAAMVTLAFRKPGAFIDSSKAIVPMILVVTQIERETNAPYTTVSGGIIIADGAAGRAYCGDSLAMFQSSDHSFDIVAAASTGGGRSRIGSENLWGDFGKVADSKLGLYMRCTGWMTIACVVAMVLTSGSPSLTPMKLSMIMSQPEIGLAILGMCLGTSMIGCLGAF